MIRVEKLSISEFRGIRDLTIDFKRKNFSICGRNGTGKSGIVDAIEFALTGNISRLSGKGTKEISIKDHAPHVDARNKPENAKVTLTVFIPSLNKAVTIERNVKQPQVPVISNNDPKVQKVLTDLAGHPEFVLSRRELIHYVLSTPGDRAKEVQALLRLDAIETLRATLLKIANASKREVEPLKRERAGSQDALLRALDIGQMQKEILLEAVNAKRTTLGLEPLTELLATTSLKDGLAAKVANLASPVPKVQAVADLKRLRELLDEIQSEEILIQVAALKIDLEPLKANAFMAKGIKRETLLRSAIELVDEEACPVCDTPWKADTLKQLITDKLEAYAEFTKKRIDAQKLSLPLLETLTSLRDSAVLVVSYATKFRPAEEAQALRVYCSELDQKIRDLKTFIHLSETNEVLHEFSVLPLGLFEDVARIEERVNEIPEPTQQDAAREYLTVCQERLETWRGLSQRLKRAESQAELAKTASDAYAAASTEVLEQIYKSVAKEFAELYAFINHDDEKDFTANLTPSMGKLGFDVDFYGRGHFPPGAYHSEGHQDAMGLCLYLALMKHLLGDGFSFAVLDDVLMSVDTGHRREVCNLLKKKFPDTQFVFTTHDQIWLKHMRSIGLIPSGNQLSFRNWNVDHGPSAWDDKDAWAEIADALAKNDVRAASSVLRHYLEYFFKEVCHVLRAPVPFSGDAHYTLGDLLPPATAKFKKLLKKGNAAALSWGKIEEAQAIEKLEASFADLVKASGIEQWQLNAAIHYNEWDTLTVTDFSPVVEAMQRLANAFACDNPECGLFYVTPPHDPDVLRCDCAAININLKKKSTSSN